MKKIEIKTIFGEVAFSWESETNTIKETVEKFLKENTDKTIRNINLSNLDLSKVSFYNSRFDNSRFDNSSFDNSSFYNSSFYNSSFYNSSFYNSSFYNSSFDNSRFDNSSFDNSRFYNSSFNNSRFDNSRFYNSRFYNSSFDNSRFDNETVKKIRAANQEKMFDSYKNDFWSILLKAIPEIPFLKQSLIDGKVDGSTYEGTCSCLCGTIATARNCHYTDLKLIGPDSSRPAERWFSMIRPEMTPDNSETVKLTIEWLEEFVGYIPVQK